MVQSVCSVFSPFFLNVFFLYDLNAAIKTPPAWCSMPCAPDMISAARSDFNLQPNKNTKGTMFEHDECIKSIAGALC